MKDIQTIEEIFSGRILQVPDYQRGYAWEKRQWDDFLEDLDLLEAGKEHYTGTLVLHAVDGVRPMRDKGGLKYDHFHIVDGQQRLTTTVLLLDAIRRSMEKVSLKDVAEGIRKHYVSVAALGSEQPIHKLQLNRDSHHFFVNGVLSDEPSPEGPAIYSHERLLGAKNHFASYLKSREEELEQEEYRDWLLDLHDKVTAQLKVSVYNIEDSAEVGVIFEVMNNRGKPLSELEKVKNYLLYLSSKLNLENNNLAEEVNRTWTNIFENLMEAGLTGTGHEDQLLRAHWLMAYDHTKKNWDRSRSVKARFSLKAYRNMHRELLSDLNDYISSLDRASLAYCDIASPRRDNAFASLRSDPALRERIINTGEKLRRINVVATFLPLLIATRLRHPEDGDKYLNMVRMCEVFAFRVYRLLRLRSNTGESMLRRLGNQVYNKHLSFDDALNSLRGHLLYYCPTHQFEAKLALNENQNNWYWWPGLKYFLYEYEEHLAKGQEVQLPWDYVEKRGVENTIEHILPQNPNHEYWTARFDEHERALLTHDLGNLCLTYHNSYYGNKPFPEKRGHPGSEHPCYSNSNLFMERKLAALEDWTKEDLLSRREDMVAWALERWRVLETAPEPPDPEEDEEEDEVIPAAVG